MSVTHDKSLQSQKFVEDTRSTWQITPVDEEDTTIYSASHPYITDGTIQDHLMNTYPVQRYWDRRYEYWPNFDNGILTDLIGLFSVTPWNAACKIAVTLNDYYPKDSPFIVDACCGVGGNTNAFATSVPNAYVFGIDTSARRIMCAKNNARVCDVEASTGFIKQDAITFLQRQNHTIRFVFCSPPWGGPGYTINSFDDIPFDVVALAEATRKATVDNKLRLVLFLPRHFPAQKAKDIIKHGEKLAMFDVTNGKKKRLIARCFAYK